MESYQEIRNYLGVNQQEKQDQQLILKYLDLFNDLLTRNNQIAHFTSSAFIVNQARTKTLFIYHKIYDTWSWTGGHVDGENDFLAVAKREAREETGLKELTPISPQIVSLDILPVFGHSKKGQWISSHQHLSVAYLFEADEGDELLLNQSETRGIKWVPFSEIAEMSQEPAMIAIYQKILRKLSLESDNGL